jgi:DNA-binding NtrC family response regulator
MDSSGIGDSRRPQASPPPPTALLVEEDSSLRTVLAEALRLNEVWQVVEEPNAARALEALRFREPDVVVWATQAADDAQPEALLRVLDAYPEHGVPCVVLATAGRGHLAIQAEGIAGFINAPFDPAGLATEVADLVRRRT